MAVIRVDSDIKYGLRPLPRGTNDVVTDFEDIIGVAGSKLLQGAP
jgi:hypothetical protein